MLLAFMLTHQQIPHCSPDRVLPKWKTVLKLPGFKVQSEEILFHVTNQRICQAKEKRVGGKMSTAALKLLLISRACVRILSAPQGHIRGIRMVLMGLFFFFKLLLSIIIQ